jgi:gliding motility-associated-like protein
MKKITILSLFLFFDTLALFAQPCLNGKERNIWYFGANAGLDFNSDEPTVLTNGQLYNAECCASIANSDGELLMYTDGLQIWNANHQVMPNGSGLLGDPSSTQGAVIVPMPLSNNKYYVFTIDDLAEYNGLRYSIVDMSLNAGLGDIEMSNKNIFLQNDVTEKLVAVRHCNQKDIWVVAHDWESNTFRAYLITETGIQAPILSNIGVVHAGGSEPNYNTVGCMKISPDGEQIAVAIRDMNLCQLFDFDTDTGILSNVISLSSPNYAVIYGVEFSSDNSKLYITSATNRSIYQFNLLAGSEIALNASSTLIGQTASNYVFGLQRAPNGKIYVARTDGQWFGSAYLGVINQPNLLGTSCNYVDNGIYLAGQMSLLGLPNYMVDSFEPVQIQGINEVCVGESALFVGTEICSNEVNYIWTYVGSGTIATPNEIQTIVNFTGAGNGMLILMATSACGIGTDTLLINVSPCNSPPTAQFAASQTHICVGDCLNFTDLSTGQPTQWQWILEGASPASSNQQNPSNICYPTSGIYSVTLIASNNALSDTLLWSNYIEVYPSYSTIIDTTLYEGETLQINGNSYNQTGTYTQALTASNGCDSTLLIQLNLIAPPPINCDDNNPNTIDTYNSETNTCQHQPIDTPTTLLIPNAFSPNQDGMNDYLNIISNNEDISHFHLSIYNRWGQKVFESNSIEKSWDGKYKNIAQEIGIYAYIVSYAINGETQPLKTGNITLIR